MKKAFIAIFFVLVCSAIIDASVGTHADVAGGKAAFPLFQWGQWYPPSFPKWPQQPGLPNLPPVNSNIQKCFGDLADFPNCLPQIHDSFHRQKISVNPACCAAVQKMTADCANTVLGVFKNLIFQKAVKQCSAAPPA